MRALSIRQPWAYLIVNGHKDIENREWNTFFRGRVLIHAGKTLEPTSELRIQFAERGIIMPPDDQFERGGIVGIATVTDCVTTSDSPWFFGPYGHVMADAKPLPFTPLRGKLTYFDCPEYTGPF